MAYDIGWTGIVSGTDDGDAVEDKLTNSFTLTETALNELEAATIANAADIVLVEDRVTVLEAPKDFVLLNPQVTPPTGHIVGRIYFDDTAGTTKIQGGISGVEVEVGHGEHIHVVNNTGVLIPKGTACRHNGVAAGKVQVVPALADTFDNARVFGLAAADIAATQGTEGALVTSGEIKDMDTNGLPTGVPLYLSDTVAGTYSTTIPDIVSQVGGAITADSLTGRFYVQTINNSNLPTVLGGMQGQTVGNDTYSLTTTAQDIDNYLAETAVVMSVDILTGIITLSNTGNYRMHFTADISFISSTSTRSVAVEFYDNTGANIEFTYTKNIPRDATEDSFSFSFPFADVADQEYKMRIKSSVAMDVTFEDISFDVQSISII